MVERKILLRSAEDARELVNIASECDFDITLKHGRVQLDAKSIVGVLGVDLRRDLTITYGGENPALHDFVERHASE